MSSDVKPPDRTLRDALFSEYQTVQGSWTSGAVYRDLRVFWSHFDANYAPILDAAPANARIIDIGCGPGSLIAWARARGFEHVEGVDLSPGDVEYAAARLGPGIVRLADGREYLRERRRGFDLIFMKALLEHVPKPNLLPMLDAAGAALTPSGGLVVEVPNMDWLAASHERYMDLTHEVGFTTSSLRSLLSLAFDDVEVFGSRLANPTRTQRWFRPLLLRVMHRTLYILGEGASETLFSHRSLIAYARRPRCRSDSKLETEW